MAPAGRRAAPTRAGARPALICAPNLPPTAMLPLLTHVATLAAALCARALPPGRAALVALTALLAAPWARGQVTVANGGFETPTVSNFFYKPSGAGWTFSNTAGISNGSINGAGFGVVGSHAGQFAFIQWTGGSSMSQDITFPSAGNYTLSYLVAGRDPASGGAGNASFSVTISPGILAATGTTTSSQPFTMMSHNFAVSSPGTYTLTFTNSTGSNDNTFYVDSVAIATNTGPTVTTPTVAGMSTTSVALGGNVTTDGGSAIIERGVVYAVTSINRDPVLGGTGVTKLTSPGTTGVFTVNATGLTLGTGYSFKAYATSSGGTAYTTPVTTFTPGTPTVTTPTITNITTSSAILGGNVTNDGGAAITARGVVYAATLANANPQIGGANVTVVNDVASTTGVFTKTITGLAANTSYSFAAFVTNAVGTTYTTPVSTFNTGSTFNYTGTNQTYTVPAGVTSLIVSVWGAGGGGGNSSFNNPNTCNGGGGAFVTGTLAVTPGQVLTLTVGGGGVPSGGKTFGGGGGTAQQDTASGGGLSAINIAGSYVVIAGGGGGGGYDIGPAGSGGLLTGGDGTYAPCGRGGTQTGGGSGGTSDYGVAPSGTALMGGDSSIYGGGGGGGGYYGGGAGIGYYGRPTASSGGGGGGSSFLGSLSGTEASSAGSGMSPGGTSSRYYRGNTGVGGLNGYGTHGAGGGNGQITIIAVNQGPVITLLGPDTITVALGQSYVDPGVTVLDDADGTVPVVTTGTVNTAVAGTYTLHYNATDSLGYAGAQVTRTVNVVPGVPTVTAISPAIGRTTGGTSVTITGTNLFSASSVTIGGVAVTNMTVVNTTTITATTPVHGAGTVDVVVTTDGGTATGVQLFTYGTTANNPPVVATAAGSGAPSLAATGSLATGRSQHTATLLPNGKVLVAGGLDGSQQILQSAEIYDPIAGTWSPTGGLITARYDHTATLLANGKVMVTGGGGNGSSFYLDSAEIYDPATGTWTATGGFANRRDGHTATLLHDGRVLVAGGNIYSSQNVFLNAQAVEIYDPVAGVWTLTGSLPLEVSGHTATLLASGKVLVAGGHTASAELYDPAAGAWTSTGSLKASRNLHTATLLADGRVLIAGGSSNQTSAASWEVYDPQTGVFTTVAAGGGGTETYGRKATLLASGKVVLAGGYGSGSGFPPTTTYPGVVLTYDPTTVTITSTSGFSGRKNLTATLLPTQNVLLAGGTSQPSGTTSSAVLYSPGMTSVVEGLSVTQAGTFSDPDGNATVTLSVSTGTVTQNNAAGTWTWTSPASLDGPATIPVTVTATDNGNLTATATFYFAVLNSPPTVLMTAPAAAYAGVGTAYTFTATDPSPADQAAGFAWSLNYGDGSALVTVPAGTASPLNQTHTFALAGNYTVTATATDKDGGVSAAASQAITINAAAAPTVTTPTSANILATLATLGGNATSDGGAAITGRGVVYALTSANGNPAIGGPGVTQVAASGTTGVFTVLVAGLAPNASYSFAAYATNSVNTSYTSVGAFTTLTASDSWRQTWFGTTSNSGNAADTAKPAGDGITNLMKYALGANPFKPATSSLPVVSIQSISGQQYVTLTFQRSLAATDITCIVEESTALDGTWNPGSSYSAGGDVPTNTFTTQVSRTNNADSFTETIVVRDNTPISPSNTHGFLRLRVTRP